MSIGNAKPTFTTRRLSAVSYLVLADGEPTVFTITRNDNEHRHQRWVLQLSHDVSGEYLDEAATIRGILKGSDLRRHYARIPPATLRGASDGRIGKSNPCCGECALGRPCSGQATIREIPRSKILARRLER